VNNSCWHVGKESFVFPISALSNGKSDIGALVDKAILAARW
jgi:hypothetical protein